jgi:SynChlorMet cassette protein ScmD
MKQTDKPMANPVVVLREELDDWAFLFNPDTSDALGINPVGVAIWKLLDGKTDLASITARLKDTFGDVPEGAANETAEFVESLRLYGFVACQS